VAHEREPASGGDPAPPPDRPLVAVGLEPDPTVEGRLGRLDAERLRLGDAVEPLHHALRALRRNRIEDPPPTDRDEEEHAPEDGAEVPDAVADRGQLVGRLRADGRVDL